jgi:hypothetical protein
MPFFDLSADLYPPQACFPAQFDVPAQRARPEIGKDERPRETHQQNGPHFRRVHQLQTKQEGN